MPHFQKYLYFSVARNTYFYENFANWRYFFQIFHIFSKIILNLSKFQVWCDSMNTAKFPSKNSLFRFAIFKTILKCLRSRVTIENEMIFLEYFAEIKAQFLEKFRTMSEQNHYLLFPSNSLIAPWYIAGWNLPADLVSLDLGLVFYVYTHLFRVYIVFCFSDGENIWRL